MGIPKKEGGQTDWGLLIGCLTALIVVIQFFAGSFMTNDRAAALAVATGIQFSDIDRRLTDIQNTTNGYSARLTADEAQFEDLKRQVAVDEAKKPPGVAAAESRRRIPFNEISTR